MIKELIEHLLGIARNHIAVGSIGYKRAININQQHNSPYYQFIIDSEPLLEKQITEGIMTLKLNIDVLGFLDNNNTPLEIQDNSLHILLDFIEYVNNDDYGIELRDYSIVGFTEYTDDNCSGVRATLQFIVPNPINLCEYSSNFIEKEDEIKIELDMKTEDSECPNELFVDENNDKLILNPIKLK